MKKVLFSGMMCATFIVFGFVVFQEKVEAGGTACTVKGYRETSSCDSFIFSSSKGSSDQSCYADPTQSDFGEIAISANAVNGECIATEIEDVKYCPITGMGGGGVDHDGDGVADEICDESDNSSDDGKSDFRVKIKTYDCNGNEEVTKIQGSKVKLYKSSGKKVDEDKTNFKGESNFYDVKEGKYNIKCEVPGYVSLKDRSKDYYKSGSEKVKDGERAHETCHLIKSSCNSNVKVNKLSQTGGSFKDLILYIFNFVF